MPVIRFIAIGLGKILSKVFGLATMSFFGRMPSRDDDRIALVGVASLTWLAIVAAAIWPEVAEMIVPLGTDDDAIRRAVAIVLAILTPLGIGGVVASLHNNRAQGLGPARLTGFVLSGFVYAAVIGVTVTALVVAVPIIKASYIVRRFAVVRMMVMIEEGRHDRVVEHVQQTLEAGDLEVEEAAPNRLIAVLFDWLGWVLGRVFNRPVAQELRILNVDDGDEHAEINIHAADLTIVGDRRLAHRVLAILADHLDEREIHLTWDEGSQDLERRASECRDRLEAGQVVERETLEEMVGELERLQLDREGWDAVRRVLYRLERDAERYRHVEKTAAEDGSR